jgi:Alpha amylase, catalytic domain/Secretion system C-terminal sorting domain
MYKKIIKPISLFLILLWANNAFAQVVTTKEAFPNGDADITIIVDLKLATDGKARALLGKTSDVYLWSGAGDDENGNAFKYEPTGQTNFNAPYDPGKMTSLGNDKWSITLNPRKYYKVPEGIEIKKLGLVIKNGAGNAQTEDLYLKLFSTGINYKIITPVNFPIIANAQDSIPLKIVFSNKVNCRILVGTRIPIGADAGLTIFEKYFQNIDSLETVLKFFTISQKIDGTTLDLTLEIEYNQKTTKISKEINIIPTVQKSEIPANTKNGINYLPNNELILSLFAPQKSFVYLIGDFNNWEKSPEYLLNKDPNSENFWIKIKGLEAGKEYAYQYLIDGTLAVADPFTEKILDPDNDKFISNATYPNLKAYPTAAKGIVSVLQTGQKQYTWKATNFERPKSEKLVIYELLIRDFTTEGTYNAALQKLPYLKNLGINAIELMPVSEFTANDSWGYNPTFYQAADKAYGTKEDLKNFIDVCHQNGIAVIIDMVLNQADEAFPYVKMYFEGSQPSLNSPFFNQSATHPFNVFRDFNHESTATQQLVDQINKFWLEEYKIDGFRFDLSKGFTQTKNTDVAAWSNYDASRVKIWKRIYDKIRLTDKTAYVILEHFAANNEEQELSDYGMMLWGNGNGEYLNAINAKTNNIQTLSFLNRSWLKPNLIGYMESHDEERLMFDIQKNGPSFGNYSSKDLNNALERAKAAAALFFLTEGPKMIWQFGELGYDISINENGRTGKKPVKWDYFEVPARKKLYQTYSELIKLKNLIDVGGGQNLYKNIGAFKQWILKNGTFDTYLTANLSLESKTVETDIPKGTFFDYFTGTEITITDSKLTLKPGEFHIYTTKKLPVPEAGLVPWAAITKEEILANEPEYSRIFIFPNPVAEEIKFEIGGNIGENHSVEIFNEAGQLFHKNYIKNLHIRDLYKIDTKKLPSGNYILNVISEGKLQTGKFYKQ